MTVIIEAPDAFRIAEHYGVLALRVQVDVVALTRKFGDLLLTQIIRNADTGHHAPGAPHIPGTGPGPNVATRDYVRSWSVHTEIGPKEVIATAGTNDVRGPRLEKGFVGVDAAGRYVDAPPYPHAGPALDKIGAEYQEALETLLSQEIAS